MDLRLFFSVPGEIRTPDLQLRRLLLYPAELPGHVLTTFSIIHDTAANAKGQISRAVVYGTERQILDRDTKLNDFLIILSEKMQNFLTTYEEFCIYRVKCFDYDRYSAYISFS